MIQSTIISSLLTIFVTLSFSSTTFGQQQKSTSLAPNDETVEMKYEDLPKSVIETLDRNRYADLEVEKVHKVGKRNAQRENHYMIRYKNDTAMVDVYLDEKGNVIDPQDSDNRSGSN